MKHLILSTTVAVLLASHLRAEAPIIIQSTTAPTLTLRFGADAGTGDGVIRYLQGTESSSPLGRFSFESTIPLTQWQWHVPNRVGISGDDGAVMWLRETGKLGLVNPTTGVDGLKLDAGDGSVTLFAPTGGAQGLKLSADGSISFGATPVVLAVSGSTLTIGNGTTGYAIVTESTGDARYLLASATSLKLGTGSQSLTTNSVAMGNYAFANGEGAFAAGSSNIVNGTNHSELRAQGRGAIALGLGSRSLAEGSSAIGYHAAANGIGAVSLGVNSNAQGNYSVAIGRENLSSGSDSISMGFQNSSSGWASMSFGEGNKAANGLSFAVGIRNQSWAYSSTSIGVDNRSHGLGSVAMGVYSHSGTVYFNAAGWDGEGAIAMGIGAKAVGKGQVAVGMYNEVIEDANYIKPTDTDAAFIVGSGYQTMNDIPRDIHTYLAHPPHPTAPSLAVDPTSQNTVAGAATVRRNALVVRRNGNVEALGKVLPTGTVESAATTGFNKFKAPVLVPASGDVSMGEFTEGEQP